MTVLTALVTAQPPADTGGSNPSKTVKSETNFVSVEGEFSIDLPPGLNGFSPIDPVEGESRGGSQYRWNIPQGFFMLGFVDHLAAPKNPKAFLELTGNNFIESMTNRGGILISRRELSLGDNVGLEIKMKLNEELIGVNRHYIVKNRIYTLTSGWKENESGEQQLKILDSFKLIDGKAIIAQKIKEAEPKPLPQKPVVKKLKSDAEDENLKGKVKTVTEESEDFSETGEAQGRYLSSITDYDETGNRIRELSYDSKALPSDITVYGYIDGMRVRNSKRIVFDDNPPLMSVGGKRPKATKAPDPRYDTSFEYKYTGGKLSEKKWIGNDGAPWLTYIYNYKGNQMEELVMDENGKLNQKYLSTLDDKGNEIERTDFDVLGNQTGDSKYSVKYESFDEKGNWTKKVTSELSDENGKQIYKPSSIDYRTIVYYQ